MGTDTSHQVERFLLLAVHYGLYALLVTAIASSLLDVAMLPGNVSECPHHEKRTFLKLHLFDLGAITIAFVVPHIIGKPRGIARTGLSLGLCTAYFALLWLISCEV